jgi:hypothetical protein
MMLLAIHGIDMRAIENVIVTPAIVRLSMFEKAPGLSDQVALL